LPILVPWVNVGVPTFAVAGMGAAIGGTTGAVLTGIVMITEMTQDRSAILPLLISGSIAYAVRKTIMDESIYTMKLLARGHVVVEGLISATAALHRNVPRDMP
jgi:chloride channel protein, CIC family